MFHTWYMFVTCVSFQQVYWYHLSVRFFITKLTIELICFSASPVLIHVIECGRHLPEKPYINECMYTLASVNALCIKKLVL